jgi:hypothetical protein
MNIGPGISFGGGIAISVPFSSELYTPTSTTKLLGLQFNSSGLTVTGTYTVTATGSLTYQTTGGILNTGYATGWSFGSVYLHVDQLTTPASMLGKTYIAWYKGTQSNTYHAYSPGIAIFGEISGSVYWGLGIADGVICVANSSASATTGGNAGSTLVNTGAWFCLAWVVKAGGTIDAYVNGVLELSGATIDTRYPGLAYIGSGYAYAGTTAPSAIDAVQILGTELSSNEIQSIYYAGIGATPPATFDYLMVAGGGGGGGGAINGWGPGGGGAGGLISNTSVTTTSGVTYTVTVGAGGTGGVSPYNGTSTQGQNSIISGTGIGTITAYGGGAGGDNPNSSSNYAGGNGGSGGGSSVGLAAGKGVYPGSTYISIARQGYDGGVGIAGAEYGGGGGGGAGGVGSNATSGSTGDGGAGGVGSGVYSTWLQDTGTGVNSGGTYYIAGGGAGGEYANGLSVPGGLGGGGNSTGTRGGKGTAGDTNTGGGGGTPNVYTGANDGSNGGSGLVIIRVGLSVLASATTGSPTVTVTSSYRYYTFTTSGSITF